MITMQEENAKHAHLLEKWAPVLEGNAEVENITDPVRRLETAKLLENQAMHGGVMNEASTSVSGNVSTPNPILTAMVRRAYPKLMSYDFMGVQAMTQKTGLVYAMSAHKVDTGQPKNAGDELFVSEPDTGFTGKTGVANSTVNDPFAALYDVAGAKTTAAGEGNITNEATFKIESVVVEAGTRNLKGSYTSELAQDMRASHGMDADSQLSGIMAEEILAETNREAARTMYKVGKLGAQSTANGSAAGEFDLQKDADGRYQAEKYSALVTQIQLEANIIGRENGFRGIGNKVLATPNVVSALQRSGSLVTPGNVDFTKNTYVGKLAGYIDVHIDPLLSGIDGVVVAYRGSQAWDAGLYYCPYVPLEMSRAVDSNSGQPIMFYRTRYGMVSNPFVVNGSGVRDGMTMAAGINPYFRKFKVSNIHNTGGTTSAVVTE